MIIKISGFAIICALCALIIKKLNATIGIGITLAGVLTISGAALFFFGDSLTLLRQIAEMGGNGKYFEVMLKALSVAFISQISSNVCRDCGESSIAMGVELVGKLEILLLCVSPIKEILSYITKILSFV